MTGRCYRGEQNLGGEGVAVVKAPQVTLSREREGERVALGKTSIVQG
jgi:hypothetical protein